MTRSSTGCRLIWLTYSRKIAKLNLAENQVLTTGMGIWYSLFSSNIVWYLRPLLKLRYLHFYCNRLNEISIFDALHFSMKNIYQSCDLVRAARRSNVDVSQ